MDFRAIPSVDRIISDSRISGLIASYDHDLIIDFVRQFLSEIRSRVSQGETCPSFDHIIEIIKNKLDSLEKSSLCSVINATGVILHTNLGRAPLSSEARLAMDLVAKGYCNLEFDLEKGKRSSRQDHIQSLLCHVTGAQAALVVNNNAAALLLVFTDLAKGKEVILSRGQAVEIGGGVRLPEILRHSGAKLVEVGTTNRTYVKDFEEVITSRTVALLRVHSSNFKLIGFTQSVPLKELVILGRKYSVIVIDDLGSGCLLDTTKFGLSYEPLVQESLSQGSDLVLFSGDKLLGGPQAGIIVGNKTLIERLKEHPLARAVRIDKISLAGLYVTLLHYLRGEALNKIPVWRLISTPLTELENRAKDWASSVQDYAEVVDGNSMIGGGSLPGSTLPTKLLSIRFNGKKSTMIMELARRLRLHHPAIIARIEKTLLLLDPRTVLPEYDHVVKQGLNRALSSLKKLL